MTIHSTVPALGGNNPTLSLDQALLIQVQDAVQLAGNHLMARYSLDARIHSRDDLLAALQSNDDASMMLLRPALSAVHPQARFVEDEMETGALPDGDWWIVDPVEGNINHIHGLNEWCVTVTLVRDNRAALTAVAVPTSGQLFTAVRGGGAFVNGAALHPSRKTDIGIAIVGTGQAEPGESEETRRRTGASISAMMGDWRVVRMSVPTTLHLLNVAGGHTDVFWEYSQVRSGLLAGALLVSEAGGVVSDTRGKPWTLESTDFLATAPALHAGAVQILANVW